MEVFLLIVLAALVCVVIQRFVGGDFLIWAIVIALIILILTGGLGLDHYRN